MRQAFGAEQRRLGVRNLRRVGALARARLTDLRRQPGGPTLVGRGVPESRSHDPTRRLASRHSGGAGITFGVLRSE
jgi:hypothetical protein